VPEEGAKLGILQNKGDTMDISMIRWLISLVSGLVGGNLSGSTAKENLGTLGNSLTGLLGGGLGHLALQALGIFAASPELSLTSILTNIGASGLGGALLPMIVSMLKKAFVKN
jgi:uncharacterized membrane protein YeaQ/YmgE (transglycosylase-associated protein family)